MRSNISFISAFAQRRGRSTTSISFKPWPDNTWYNFSYVFFILSGFLILLRHEIASSGVTVRATLRQHFLGESGHERGSAGTVYGLRRGARRGDRACRSGEAGAWLLSW